MAAVDFPPSILHGPRSPYPSGGRVDKLVDLAAERHPDRTAIRFRNTTLTYGEMVRRADRAATALAEIGVSAGDVVIVHGERTPDAIITLFALMKAGAIYAGLPGDWPATRCAQLVRQTNAVLCLATDPQKSIADIPVVSVGDLLAMPGRDDAVARTGRETPEAEGNSPFCVFSTSGSTGRPKAVLAPHRGVVRAAIDLRRLHDGPPVSLQLSSMAWDVFALETWATLINGGTCVLLDDHYLTGHRLREVVKDGLSMLTVATPVFGMLVEDDLDSLAGLQLVMVGGDRLPAAGVRRFLGRHPGIRLVNAYGPVENTINTTLWTADDGIAGDVPIGIPATNTSVRLLDDHGAAVRLGQVGEIAVSGHGLAMGYAGSPEETAERFVTIIENGEPLRVYLTGDLARIGTDGQLYFTGRKDRQVKVRGLRVELEEVERLAESIPGVRQCVALALPHGAGNKTDLAAFYLSSTAPVPPDVVRAERAVTSAPFPGEPPQGGSGGDDGPLTAKPRRA